MSTYRLVPYVEIIVPRKTGTRRRLPSPTSSVRSPSSGKQHESGSSELETFTRSPRKRRKLNTVSEDEETTASSEFLTNNPPESETIIGQQAITDEDQSEYDEAARRSPSLGAFSHGDGPAVGYYVPDHDEIVEDESPLPDETSPEDLDETNGDIPVRILDDYTIYNTATREIIHLAQLLLLDSSDTKYSASGVAKAWIDPDSEEDEVLSAEDTDENETSVERLQLSKILEFCVHNLLEGQKVLDPKIYIRTKYAWYILGIPSASYLPYFAPFWTSHRILHLFINSCLKNYRLTYEEFKENLQDIDAEEDSGPISASDILGRNLELDQDLNSDETICLENSIKISRVPAVREIMGPEHYDFDVDISSQRSKKEKKSRPAFTSKSSNKEIEILRNRNNKTFLTATVNDIAKDFFHVAMEAIRQEDVDETASVKLPRHKGHYTDPLKIVWGDSFPGGKVFKSATVDGIVYKIGDIVMVEPDDNYKVDAAVTKSSQTVNQYGNRYWFIQIRYFFDKLEQGKKNKMLHGVWLSHGSKTILQEAAHSKSLFFLNSCDHIPVNSIFKKCDVNYLKPGYPEPPDNGAPDATDFHCMFLHDENDASFCDIPEDVLDFSNLDEGYTCFSCDEEDRRKANEEPRHYSDRVCVDGVDYHLHDFVYIQPTRDGRRLLEIGQIVTLHDSDRISINMLGRYDEYVEHQKKTADSETDLVSDERRLFMTDDIEDIALHQLDGICHILHLTDPRKIQEWISHDDHYYLNSKGDIKNLHAISKSKVAYCKACYAKEQEVIGQASRLADKNEKLIGMELFSGAGGLGIGMDLSGFVETRYAVEFSPSAAKTYARNHPNTKVYCQDTNHLLKHAITGLNSEGKRGPLKSNDEKTMCPPLPKKGEPVDFIFGGPPCQSFSRMNHSKRRDDIRSSLACNMLSYVEHYEPKYFLLENVAGFLDHKLYTKQQTASGRVEERIVQFGMIKFCFRTLIALGYQVRYRLLQAGDYGAPQSRRRVIIWGARRGEPLPQFPVPVYAFPKRAWSVKLPSGGRLEPPTRSKGKEHHNYAPLRPRTVNDAIGDLPPFDWINPHRIIASSTRDREESRRRLYDMKIPRFDAMSDSEKRYVFDALPGFPGGAKYPMPPKNRYQEWLRQGMEEDELVTGQYTTRFAPRIVEATVNVPLRPLADHRDLPGILLGAKRMRQKDAKGKIFYGRMDGNGHFKCAVTTLSPATKSQWPVHPTQKRIITVREAARSQGFPDHYVFESSNKRAGQIVADQLRQIGNAVAVPFALALGKELGKALLQTWERTEREGSVEA
ncbi:DNA (cytosine-5)-methyltransferase 4 [Psilocybe cubensis]|uniref:DNA (Cytosine-5)-methyltransferase 4 n=1 Tax=Psilocybe cubensis TaxID=181762 RepID=A0ACB8H889_PSICU|nr:DNA (cytosine-5)-methyltransferase 4 [Psilocybe cubensis]KAH9483930.1 DNA (cytosine-5)-methyltransferase 4 [Psilocybe cubensis]